MNTITIQEYNLAIINKARIDFLKRTNKNMPKGTKVERCYQKLKKSKGKGSAAAICQKSTGLSLKTGKKPKKK